MPKYHQPTVTRRVSKTAHVESVKGKITEQRSNSDRFPEDNVGATSEPTNTPSPLMTSCDPLGSYEKQGSLDVSLSLQEAIPKY